MNILKRGWQVMLLSSVLLMGSAQASLLWKITSDELPQPSYLFGTIHLICEQDFFMDERIETALAESDALVKEIDLSSPEIMLRLQQLMVNTGGPYLQEYLSADQLAVIDEYFTENFGAGLAQLGVLKPLALSSMVLTAGLPCTDIKSYEMELADLADQHDLAILELESVDFQMQIFDDIPLEDQVAWLWQGIAEEQESQRVFQTMVDAYVAEDLDKLLEAMRQDAQMMEYFDVLLNERNHNWIAPIREMIHAQQVFIAVGAGHLPGEQGVIRLLEEAGYTVEPVTR